MRGAPVPPVSASSTAVAPPATASATTSAALPSGATTLAASTHTMHAGSATRACAGPSPGQCTVRRVPRGSNVQRDGVSSACWS